ncbi:hypothetical protein HHL23_14400 [Chryseobacterium sp. RP-3-3]|uniref:Uncharacterized protein n=1 Tax=Chryseobacterium antibioticum TaxID=2728847 RepID=A0A7Y0FS64_9FLAO|nr:hypothetical protein [Chryseobacterium antibioticum]NML70977.1 hypothetical protein [Chryseobacterium antibioticum]
MMKKASRNEERFFFVRNKKLSNLSSITAGRAETNIRTTSETGSNGQPGNTGDTAICNDGKQVATIPVD